MVQSDCLENQYLSFSEILILKSRPDFNIKNHQNDIELSQFYSYHIPSFQSCIWISPKAGFWYERQERRGVLFTLKDGVQFEKNILLLKGRFCCSKAGFRFRKAGFTLRKAGFLLKGRKGGVCFSL